MPIATEANLLSLPSGLPHPIDDGAARHLPGRAIPSVRLRSTRGRDVDVSEATQHLSVLFFYPATVAPGIPIPGEWSRVPGARGCTLENCAVRDRFGEFRSLGCEVFGVSGQGQGPEEGLRAQVEFAKRAALPYELLNDSRFELVRRLELPTFVANLKEPVIQFERRSWSFPLQGRTMVKRLTLVADGGRIEKVFYPVFPPDQSAATVLDYLRGPRTAPTEPIRFPALF
ncbi:MAG: peroxiredoxin, partial [Thermoplasmata archaeon]